MIIREKRKNMNITQDDLANRLGVSRTAVTKWEVGIANPKTDLLPKIADIFECTIDELFGRGAQESGEVQKGDFNGTKR